MKAADVEQKQKESKIKAFDYSSVASEQQVPSCSDSQIIQPSKNFGVEMQGQVGWECSTTVVVLRAPFAEFVTEEERSFRSTKAC